MTFYKFVFNNFPVSIIFCSKYRIFLLFYLLIISWQEAFTQINFQKFPQNNQVLQRNDQNEGFFSVKGTVTENGHSSVTLMILQDGNAFSQSTIILDESKTFDFSPKIKAGKYNYTVKLYLDGTSEIKSVTRVAVGDLFLVYGQSNAMGNGGNESYVPNTNPFIRFFYTNYYNPNDFVWILPFETFMRPGTGIIELEKFLANNYDYPIGVIASSEGGVDIKQLNYRNSENPTDLNSLYGKMLKQTINSDVKDELKYFIFRQGESDGNTTTYPEEFDKLYQNLHLDFPKLTKIFNFQIDILTENVPNAAVLRDFQRRTKYLYPKITVLSTVGTKEFDGLHYGLGGYSQTAFELSRVIGKEVYGENSSSQIYSPDIKTAYRQNGKLILAFDESMQMTYPNDTLVNGYLYQMKNFIYVDGKNDVVKSGYADGNKIILEVSDISTAKLVSYLPASFGQWNVQNYKGTHFKNALGMRAFSFHNVAISGDTPPVTTGDTPPVTTGNIPPVTTDTPIELSLLAHEDIMVKLNWNGNNLTKYHIERSVDNSGSFVEVGTINGDTYFDTQVSLGKTYFYRIYAENMPSTKSNAKEITLKCLDNVNLKSFPDILYIGANISISAIVTISKTKQLSLEAQKSIDLNHGFDAELGSDFSAEIGGCKNN